MKKKMMLVLMAVIGINLLTGCAPFGDDDRAVVTLTSNMGYSTVTPSISQRMISTQMINPCRIKLVPGETMTVTLYCNKCGVTRTAFITEENPTGGVLSCKCPSSVRGPHLTANLTEYFPFNIYYEREDETDSDSKTTES